MTRMRNYCLKGTVSFWDHEKVLETGSGDGCITLLTVYTFNTIKMF